MNCNKCGAQISKGSDLCPVCKQNGNVSLTAKKKRSPLKTTLIIIGIVLILACAFTLIFSFIKNSQTDNDENVIGLSTPEKAAEEYLNALFSGDTEKIINIIHPDCLPLLNATTDTIGTRMGDYLKHLDGLYGEGWHVKVNSSTIQQEFSKDAYPIDVSNLNAAISRVCQVECNSTLVSPGREDDNATLYVIVYLIDGRWHAISSHLL